MYSNSNPLVFDFDLEAPDIALGDLEDATDEDEAVDLEDVPVGFIPTLDSSSAELENGTRFVEYVTRGPNDVVLSGPIVGGWGPGRYYRNRRLALTALTEKYGEGRVIATRQSRGRWSFLIKNLKQSAKEA